MALFGVKGTMSKQTGSFDLNSCSEDLESWPFWGFRVIGQLTLMVVPYILNICQKWLKFAAANEPGGYMAVYIYIYIYLYFWGYFSCHYLAQLGSWQLGLPIPQDKTAASWEGGREGWMEAQKRSLLLIRKKGDRLLSEVPSPYKHWLVGTSAQLPPARSKKQCLPQCHSKTPVRGMSCKTKIWSKILQQFQGEII